MKKEEILEGIGRIVPGTLMETLGIEYCDLGDDYLTARMPVDERVYQPDGVLHGGATVALAESVGSAACFVFLDTGKFIVRGIEISANHVRSVRSGYVYARASLWHKGRTTQIWNIEVTDEEGRRISLCKLTTITLEKET
jgi:uncharacterized protein (TIGR00369 family)